MGKCFVVLIAVALGVGQLTADRLSAEQLELPFETSLAGESIRLELRHANLDIVRDASAEASLSVRLLTPVEGSEETLDARIGSGFVQLARGGETGGETTATEPRWLVELVVAPEQLVEVVGVDLDVVVEAIAREAANVAQELTASELKRQTEGYLDDEEAEKEKKERLDAEVGQSRKGANEDDKPTLDLQVDRSNVNLVGVNGVSLDAIECFIHTDGTSGVLLATLRGGSAEVLGHQGPLTVSAHQAEVWLEEPEANVAFAIEGGTLNLIGGEGQSEGKVRDAFVRFEGWRGPTLIDASEATLEMVSMRQANLQISGPGLEVIVEEIQGGVETNLLGGRLIGRDLNGQVNVTARGGAEVELDAIRGALRLSLADAAAARITDVVGALQGNVHDAQLDIEGVRQLQLRGLRAELRLADLERIRQIELTDSRLDIDLSGLRHDPLLTLRGASEASVRIEAPCGVKLVKSDDAQFAQVDVSGCMMHSSSQGRVMFGRRGLQGNRQMMLRLSLSPESTAEVEGVY